MIDSIVKLYVLKLPPIGLLKLKKQLKTIDTVVDSLLEKITLDDMKKAVRDLLNSKNMITVRAGRV